MKVIAFSNSHYNFDKLKKKLPNEGTVFVQGPKKFQPFVEDYLRGALPYEIFLHEISKRTGTENPETSLLWVKLVYTCQKHGLNVKLIEPDIDPILKKVSKELHLKDEVKFRVLQEARMWFLSNSGYVAHFYAAFDTMFFWLPFHLFFRRLWLKIAGAIVNLIPGDQQDVLAAVSKAYDEIGKKISEELKEAQDSTVFLEESIADKVERRIAEM